MISIIIPTLNEASVLSETLKRFKASVTHRFEIIVSDGGSSDATLSIAKGLADKVVEKGEGRQTIGMGRNAGAAVASGEFLAFFDADVAIPDPDSFFDAALELFHRRADVVALTGQLRVLPESETRSDRFFFSLASFVHYVQNNWLHVGAASGEFQIVRRTAFEKLGGYDEKISVSEDQEFFRRLSKIGRTYFDRHLTVYHTGRRAHKIGWLKLLSEWALNDISVRVTGKAWSDTWKQVR